MDCAQLKTFYESSLGGVARRALCRSIRTIWPKSKGERVLGLGYTSPFIRPFMDDAQAVYLAIPQRFGALPWPHLGPNCVTLTDPQNLPFAPGTFDKILMVHGLEFMEHSGPVLEECWRILAPGGRLLICTPNRTGIWSHMDRTPFGYGAPFTARQLTEHLTQCYLTPLSVTYSLMMPPTHRRTLLKFFSQTEHFSNGLCKKLAGVIIMEAQKKIYQPIGQQTLLAHRTFVLNPA